MLTKREELLLSLTPFSLFVKVMFLLPGKAIHTPSMKPIKKRRKKLARISFPILRKGPSESSMGLNSFHAISFLAVK